MTGLEGLLLSVIRDNGPCHGLDIGREAERRTGRLVGAGSLYRALHRMEGEGYLSAYWEGESESTHRGPRRRYYEVTGAGAHALNDYWDQLQTAGRALRMKPEPAS